MLEQNAMHLASPDTYIKYAIQMSICLAHLFIHLIKVCRIMVWHMLSVCPSIWLSIHPSVNIWLSTGVTTCRIDFNFSNVSSSAPHSGCAAPYAPLHSSHALHNVSTISKFCRGSLIVFRFGLIGNIQGILHSI